MQARRGAKPSFGERVRRFIDPDSAPDARRIAELEAECAQLRERLHAADQRGRTQGEALYELQRQYSVEHFDFQESMRNLKIERMRNAGMFGDRDVVLGRAKELQARIRDLKERLRRHEAVDDWLFDDAPIVIENPKPGQGA